MRRRLIYAMLRHSSMMVHQSCPPYKKEILVQNYDRRVGHYTLNLCCLHSKKESVDLFILIILFRFKLLVIITFYFAMTNSKSVFGTDRA